MKNLRSSRAALVAAGVFAVWVSNPAYAANWLMLQGTEPEAAAARARIWGFIQPQFEHRGDSTLSAGPFKGQDAVFNQVGPDLTNNDQFQLRRARLGVRGTAFPLDSDVNYFFLLEAGNNGVTKFTTDRGVALTDASVTLNHFKRFTRVRFGQFKYPGSEDGLQAIHVHNYVNFATPSDQLLLERFFQGDGFDTQDANEPTGFNAFRDIGLQLFNAFQTGEWLGYPWEHSYAAMVGNGNGINRGDDNSNKDLYLYASTGQIFAGKGARRQDWKLFAWYQKGDRKLETQGSPDGHNYERQRWGLGLTFRKDRYRLYAEYYQADGVIFSGTDGGAVPGAVSNAGTSVASFNVFPNQEAYGWYVDVGYKVLPNVELDYRFAYLDRATNPPEKDEREFWDHTFGIQYWFNKKVRAILNYQLRDAEADNNSVADDIVSDVDNVFSAQVLAIF